MGAELILYHAQCLAQIPIVLEQRFNAKVLRHTLNFVRNPIDVRDDHHRLTRLLRDRYRCSKGGWCGVDVVFVLYCI